MLDRLTLWMDPVARAGPDAMAVDEWLLESCSTPVLRVYRWDGAWGSLGYFGKLEEARMTVPGVSWVRRWTGGGVVDHRQDWTYTLAIPSTTAVSKMKGSESYRWIHSLLAEALQGEGIAASLSGGDAETGAALCFSNPVCHDIVDRSGSKIAGAGQRRTRHGLLHQGSVASPCTSTSSHTRACNVAKALCGDFGMDEFFIPPSRLHDLARSRYALPSWTARR